MEVLLVIDMQNAWLNNDNIRCFDAEGVINRINHGIQSVRQRGGKIIFVQHGDNDAVVGTDPWQVISLLNFADGDLTVEKRACDPFADTDLLAKLETLGARSVYISGFATEFCVDSAIRATTSRGFDVVVLADAHTTSNRPHLKAEDIVKHHNWIWENMAVPAANSLKVRVVHEAFLST